MNIQDAIDVIESVAGFTDESTPVGEAWLEVLSFIHRPTALARPEPEGVTDEGIPQWSEGVCGDGAAILRDGVMMPIEEVVASLNRAEILTRYVSQTRAALAQPEPEGVTDEEIEQEAIANADTDDEYRAFKRGAFFVQERISRPTIKPLPVAERPWEREG